MPHTGQPAKQAAGHGASFPTDALETKRLQTARSLDVN